MDTKTAEFIARTSRTYTDSTAHDLQTQINSLRADIETEKRSDAKVKITVHLVFIVIGMLVSAAVVIWTINPYFAIPITACPSLAIEINDFIKKL